jgi:tetratricopeptide (TPR) repeat protein
MSPRPAPPAPFAPGAVIGRYQLGELLGSGGMGRVYRAHDPHLSRDIALKVLHQRYAAEREAGEYRRRLLREAQALAKLSHPNVVAAFDVGTFGDVVFVAMELVQGESLRSWLLEPRRQSEVLRVLIAAGHGLVAAHAAAVLHRDFKPANVMVSPDGRVRVVDFGLARLALAGAELADGAAPAPSEVGERPSSLLDGDLTEPGILMGTPGYISPEQLRGEPADVLADQYSFAVTAFVALTGQKPSERSGGSDSSDDHLDWPRSVPRRVRRIVERGLAPLPSLRHPSVAAMVEALEREVAPRRRTGALAALAFGAMLIAAGTAVLKARSSRATCQVAAGSFQQVWDSGRRAALHDALASTGRPNAEEAFGLLAGRLDAFQAGWLAMKQESCAATYVRGEQSEKVLALRTGCLERKLAGAGALVTAFSRPDPGAVDRAAGAMPDSIEECADTAVLLGTADRLPPDPAARATIARLESAFAVTRSLAVAGQYKEARAGAEAQLAQARTLGHQPTIAQALRSAAFAIYSQARTADERKQGEAYLREAIPLAARAGDDRLVASTSSYLFNLMAYGQRRILEAEAMLPHVEALVIRAGGHPQDRLEVLYGQAWIMAQKRKFPEAIALFKQVMALSDGQEHERKAYGANARAEIGEIALLLHDYPEAVRRMREALVALEGTFGGHHPRILIGLANLALAESKVDGDAALATVARMRALAATLPSADWRAITIPFLEGQIREDRADCAHALPFYRDALARFTTTYGAEASQVADVHERLVACLAATQQRGEALAHLEHVLSIRRGRGDTPSNIAGAAFELGKVLAAAGSRAGERARAVELAQEALGLWKSDGVADKQREAEQWLAAHGAGVSPVTPVSSVRVARE